MGARTKYEWTLQELQERVQAALYLEPIPRPDKRVGATLNARTIRYYITLGLLGKPELRGGGNYYARFHLRDILAIKRLQASGKTLEQIKKYLPTASNHALRTLSRVPTVAKLDVAIAEMKKERETFWSAPAAQADLRPAWTVLRGLELQVGTILTFKTCRDLLPSDVEAINAAAAPLLETLNELGLLP